MALKKKITKEAFEKLPDVLKSEYVANGDDYVLDVDGEEDTGALKRAKDREKQRADELATQIKDLQSKLDALDTNDARKRGDIDALTKSYEKKIEDLKTELGGKLTKSQEFARKTLIDETAKSMAVSISTVPSLMTKAIKERLLVDFDGDEPALKILDASGKLSAFSLDDLKKDFLTNKEYSSILIGSKASGGGASKLGTKISGAEGEKPVNLSQLKPKELAERIKANKENQNTE